MNIAIILVLVLVLLFISSVGGYYYFTAPTKDTTAPAEDTTAPVIPTRTYTSLTGVDYVGGDIKYFEGSFDECNKECDKTTGCIGYITHKDNGKNCWLKNVFANPTTNANRDTFYTGTAPPSKSFKSLQTLNVSVKIDPSVDDGSGRTNAINNGKLISTWGKTVSGYTHVRIGSNIMKITFEGAYNFYGYFVDGYGNKIQTPYQSTTNITSFELGTF